MNTSAHDPKTVGPIPSWSDTRRSPALMLASWWGSGLSPVAPGTVGSLFALPAIALIHAFSGVWGLLAGGVLLFGLGVWAAGSAGRAWGQVDHGAIVIDEVVGQLLTVLIPVAVLANWAPLEAVYAAGFVLFRVFDIVKPWPAGWLDRHSKNGLGVMLDDVAAGVWAGFVLTALLTAFLGLA